MNKILGLGNALVDILARLKDDELLKKLNLPKGSMQLVDAKTSEDVLNEISNISKQQVSGGSAANTIHGAATLGVNTGYIGKVGDDELGSFFSADMSANNIEPKLLIGNNPTGKAVALISPDSERTFATFLGAAIELNADDIVEELFDGYKYFHIEGYLVSNQDLIEKALRIAKSKGLIVSLDLASYNVVEENLDFLTEIINKYVDVLFANEEEAKAFTGSADNKALDIMADVCDIAVLKLGSKGSVIKQGNEVVNVSCIKANPIDTTGAGDLYASGFLYGLTKKISLQKCGELGALLSGNVIEFIGPKISDERWVEIKKKANDIVNS